MATGNTRNQCYSCHKQTRTYLCQGCSQNFCFEDLTKHHQDLHAELEKIENDHGQFRQMIIDQKENIGQSSSIKQIDQWEKDSIDKIQQRAKECREEVIEFKNKCLIKFEDRLNNLMQQIRELRSRNQFNEFDLNLIQSRFRKIREDFEKPKNISIEQDSSRFIPRIFVILPIDEQPKWKQEGVTIIGKDRPGIQLYSPVGVVFDNDQNMLVADYNNNRIVEWKFNSTNGQVVLGERKNQLKHPVDMIINKEDNSLIIADQGNRRVIRWLRHNDEDLQILISDIDCFGLAMDKNGGLYVADFKKNEVKRWRNGVQNGTTIAGGNGSGAGLHQLHNPTFIFVDDNESLFISDRHNHRIIKWIKGAKEGIVVAGGNKSGNRLTQLSSPRGIVIDQSGEIYIADCDNHRVIRWREGCDEGTIVVGGNGEGEKSNQLNCPRGLSFDEQGNLYVIDLENNRIQKFDII